MQKASPKILLQLTDIHVLPEGELLSGSVDTGANFKRAVQKINSLSVKPEAIVITGDLVEDGSLKSYRYLEQMMQPLSVPVYIMPGNHDNRTHLLEVFPNTLRCKRLSHTEFIQYAVDIAGVRLIVLDTLAPNENHGELCQVRLDWLEEALAEKPDMPTIIAMHHPPFDTGMVFMDKVRLTEGDERLKSLVIANPQVQRIICGHQHRGCVQAFGGTVALVAPSSSHQLDLQLTHGDPLGYTCEQPLGSMHIWYEENPNISSHLFCLAGTPNPVLFEAS